MNGHKDEDGMTTKGTKDTEVKSDEDILALCDRIRQISFDLHTYLRHGHLEKVYENGLFHRLRKAGLEVEQQRQLLVQDDDGTVLGDYFADLFVDNRLIIELKACKALANEHTAQVLGYLCASGRRHALLINFGSPRIQFKKLIL
jgi:GxxExxY protein